MRRSVVVLGALLVGSSLVVGPTSNADPGPTVVRSLGAFPSWELAPQLHYGNLERVGCVDPFGPVEGGSPLLSFQRDQGAPMGTRVWQVDDPTPGAGSAVGPSVFTPSADSLTVATVDVNPSSTLAGVASVLALDVNTFQSWAGTAVLPTVSPGWQTVSSADLVYQWRSFDEMAAAPTGPVVATDTFEHFLQPRSWTGVAKFGFAYGCDSGASFRTDRWSVGYPGYPGTPPSMTTYDLEGTATRIDMGVVASAVTAGQPLAVTGELIDTDYNEPVAQPLQLEAMPYGTDSFVPVTMAGPEPGGTPTSAVVRPKVATTYRWVFPEEDCCEGSVSDPVTVQVRTAVTSALAKSKVRKGKAIKLTGRTTPAKPGSGVTLYRRTASGQKKLDTAKVGDDGRFLLSARAGKKGTWKVFAVVAGDPANLTGTSSVLKAKVV